MANNNIPNIVVENANIRWTNFAGVKTDFNRSGERNFCLFLDDEGMADQLRADGWNVKSYQKNPDDEIRYYIPVSVTFDPYPPRVFLVTSRNKTRLTEETIGQLDDAEIVNVDLEVRPYEWNVNGKTGIKAYLKTMYVTIREDVFAYKYE